MILADTQIPVELEVFCSIKCCRVVLNTVSSIDAYEILTTIRSASYTCQ